MIPPHTYPGTRPRKRSRFPARRRRFLTSCTMLAIGSLCGMPSPGLLAAPSGNAGTVYTSLQAERAPNSDLWQSVAPRERCGVPGGLIPGDLLAEASARAAANRAKSAKAAAHPHRQTTAPPSSPSKKPTGKKPPSKSLTDKPPANGSAAPAPGQPQITRGKVWVTFSQVDVRSALAQLADFSGVDLMLTPSASGTVSLSLRDRTVDEAVHLIASSAGLAVIKANEVYIIGPAAEVQKAAAQFGRSEIMSLQYMEPADAVNALSRAVPTVHAEAIRGGVVVSGLAPELEAARDALHMLDVPPTPAAVKSETGIITVKTIDPMNAEKILQEAFPGIKIVRHERTLILTGPQTDLQALTKTMETLDVAGSNPPEVSVYRLQYLNAQRAEESLKKVLPNLIVAAAPEATAPPAAVFNPLSGGFQSTNGTGATGSGGGSGTSGQSGAGGSTGTAASQALSRATRLILMGSKDDISAAKALLEQTDLPQPLVRIEAALVEISEDGLKQLGVNWDFTNTNFTFTIPAGNGVDFNNNIARSSASFGVALQALITKNQAHILASPNISVIDNEDASIFIGDLRRFRGATVLTPGVGSLQSTETIPVGIALLVRPRVHPDGNVTLKVHPVVSTVTSIVDGLPQTASREADTTVRLHEGEQLVIGGLTRTERTQGEQKVPLLGDLPIFGEFFRSRTYNTTRTQVVVVIRAYPVLTEAAPVNKFPVKELK